MIIQVTRKTGRILLIILALIAAGGIYLYCERDMFSFLTPERVEEAPQRVPETEDLSPAAEPETPDTDSAETVLIAVHVSGAVRDPDKVYYLPPGSRIEDAVRAAGGVSKKGDLSALNLAGLLADGQKVYVPVKGETQTQSESSMAGVLPEPDPGLTLTNINFASTIELESLPGIGENYARRIIEYREENGPFQSIEEIKNVKGIGDGIFAKIRDHITI